MIYMDNAATTMQKPQQVIDAVAAAMCSMGNAGRGAHAASLGAARTIYDAREKLACFFHAENPKQIAFTMNSTESLNIALKGVLNPGDHVITTMLEHNSVLRPLYELQEKGTELTILKSNPQGTLDYEDFEKAIKENTKAIVCTHGSNLTGNLVDVKRVGEIAKKHGVLFIVDASQTAGSVPVSMRDMNIAVLCFTGHKGLMGPQGTGGLLVREDIDLKPLMEGGSGIHSYDRRQPKDYPEHLEAGTLNTHGIAGLLAAVRFLKETGVAQSGAHERALAQNFYEQLRDLSNVRFYGDFEGEKTGIVTLNIDGYDSGEVSDELMERFGIATRSGAHCAPLAHKALGTVDTGAVRFSFSYFNTMEDAKEAAEAVRTLVTE